MLKTASAGSTVSMKEGQGLKKVMDFTHFASTRPIQYPHLTDDETTAKRSFTLKSAAEH